VWRTDWRLDSRRYSSCTAACPVAPLWRPVAASDACVLLLLVARISMSFEAQRDRNARPAEDSGMSVDERERTDTSSGSVESAASGASASTGDGARHSEAGTQRGAQRHPSCELCGSQLRVGQSRNYHNGQLAHQKCVSRHRRATAPLAVPQPSDDAMEDGLHALHSAAQLLLQ
jgi:hypothetical protein